MLKYTYIYLVGLISIFLMPSCHNSHAFDKNIKELDSLNIVVVQAIDNFRSVDSNNCILAYQKNTAYGKFLDKNLKDTVNTKTAETLQLFYSTHIGIKNYVENRGVWLKDATSSRKQLSNLVHDLKNGSIETEEAIGYITTEKQQAIKIIEELKKNTEVMRDILDTHAKYTPGVEAFIKSINNGNLPQLQKVSLIK